MDRRRLIRGLRIAWSMWWGMLCVLLVVLWVYSYWHRHLFMGRHPDWGLTYAASLEGKVSWLVHANKSPRNSPRWQASSTPIEESGILRDAATVPEGNSARSFTFVKHPDLRAIVLPYWSLILCTAGVATFPWIHWSKRFSLRTLLIATALMAGVLGLVVVWSSS